MIECVTVGDMIPTHSYFYIDDASKHGFLIDAGAEGGRLAAHAAERAWTIERLLLTHCHFDHIGGVDDFRAHIPCPVCAAAESPRYCSDLESLHMGRCARDACRCGDVRQRRAHRTRSKSCAVT